MPEYGIIHGVKGAALSQENGIRLFRGNSERITFSPCVTQDFLNSSSIGVVGRFTFMLHTLGVLQTIIHWGDTGFFGAGLAIQVSATNQLIFRCLTGAERSYVLPFTMQANVMYQITYLLPPNAAISNNIEIATFKLLINGSYFDAATPGVTTTGTGSYFGQGMTSSTIFTFGCQAVNGNAPRGIAANRSNFADITAFDYLLLYQVNGGGSAAKNFGLPHLYKFHNAGKGCDPRFHSDYRPYNISTGLYGNVFVHLKFNPGAIVGGNQLSVPYAGSQNRATVEGATAVTLANNPTRFPKKRLGTYLY